MAGNRAVAVGASLDGAGDEGPLFVLRCAENEVVRVRDGFPIGDIRLEIRFDDGPSMAITPDGSTGTDAYLREPTVVGPIKDGLRRGATLSFRMSERAPFLTVPLTGAAAGMAEYDAACPDVMAEYEGLNERLVRELLARPREDR